MTDTLALMVSMLVALCAVYTHDLERERKP